MDNRGNSRANTCNRSRLVGRDVFTMYKLCSYLPKAIEYFCPKKSVHFYVGGSYKRDSIIFNITKYLSSTPPLNIDSIAAKSSTPLLNID